MHRPRTDKDGRRGDGSGSSDGVGLIRGGGRGLAVGEHGKDDAGGHEQRKPDLDGDGCGHGPLAA